jgi:tetrachlorobenzoquinone reductase
LTSLSRESGMSVRLNFYDESGHVLDVASVVAGTAADAHLYACGPEPMLAAFELVTRSHPAARVHVERFGIPAQVAPSGSFKVVLARSGAEVIVPPGGTILQAVLDAGIDAPHSCLAGVCGTCETRVLAGSPDHRDFVLDEEQRASNDVIMICCSGSKSEALVLDL